MRSIEIRYTRRASLRSMRVWLAHGWLCDTPAVGPVVGARLFGWSVSWYPWMPKGWL